MKTILFYFSGTGNTLYIAKEIQKHVEDLELINIATAEGKKYNLENVKVGFLYPVYASGIPSIVVEFIRRVDLSKISYLFGISNYGGEDGNSLLQLERIIRKKGVRLNRVFGIRMPGNYIVMYGAKDNELQKHLIDNAVESTKIIAESIKKNEEMPIEGGKWNISGIIIYKLAMLAFKKRDRNFHVTDKCIQCKICLNICPKKNIEWDGNHPFWLGKCEQCMACIQWCPVEAIQYKDKTQERKRYTNPNINVKELINTKS